jgi:peptidoglycan/LPS O-acetylase OafA/YrhL
MRAVAVLLVLLSHGGISGLAGGYVGVDVFFVISGFLITGILVREVRTRGQVSIAEFYARRARRILPAATVTLAAVALASAVLLRSSRVEEVLDHVRWSALFAANIWSARSGSDYFSEEGFVSPVQHFWSLAVEEQFYVVWPALIALVVWLGRRRVAAAVAGMRDPDAASARFRLRQVAVVLAVLSLVSLGWSCGRPCTTPTAPTSRRSLAAGSWESAHSSR